MTRTAALTLLSTGAIASLKAFQTNSNQAHIAWVAQVMQRIKTIKPGMTRALLLTVFITQGCLYTPLQRTYVSQDCPYFHVDVKFQAAGGPSRREEARDVITEISCPYLDFFHID